MLPFQIYKREGKNKILATDHPAYYLLAVRPNPAMTATTFWELVQQKCDNMGNAYCPMERDLRGNITKIDIIANSTEVQVYIGEGGDVYYKFREKVFASSDMLHFKGYTTSGRVGLSLTDYHSETIGRMRAMQKFSNRSISENPGMYATSAAERGMNEMQMKAFKDYWKKQMDGFGNRGDVPVLYGGYDLKTVGVNPKDALYLEQINATKEDIFGITRVPPKLAQNFQTGSTYNNSEQQTLDFLIWTLNPLIKNKEEECDYKLFSTKEQGQYYCKFNEKALLRTDTKTQSEFIVSMVNNGLYSINEGRSFLDENPIEGGDDHYVQGNNLVPLRLMDAYIEGKAGISETDETEETSEVKAARMVEKIKKSLNGHVN
jgi:HK97 family phage portal protein